MRNELNVKASHAVHTIVTAANESNSLPWIDVASLKEARRAIDNAIAARESIETGLARILAAAKAHDRSIHPAPTMEATDLERVLAQAWAMLTSEQRAKLLQDDVVDGVLSWGRAEQANSV